MLIKECAIAAIQCHTHVWCAGIGTGLWALSQRTRVPMHPSRGLSRHSANSSARDCVPKCTMSTTRHGGRYRGLDNSSVSHARLAGRTDSETGLCDASVSWLQHVLFLHVCLVIDTVYDEAMYSNRSRSQNALHLGVCGRVPQGIQVYYCEPEWSDSTV